MGNPRLLCMQKFHIKQTLSQPYSPWQVRAEGCIREIEKSVRRLMDNTKAPTCLWDYCAVYACEIHSLTAHPHFALQGRTPYELVTGKTSDLSEYVEFSWYDPLWYYDQEDFPESRRRIGRWLGAAHHVGQACCYYILPRSGEPIVRSTVQPLTADEMKSREVMDHLKADDLAIATRLDQKDLPPMPNVFLTDEDEDVPYDHVESKCLKRMHTMLKCMISTSPLK